MIAADTLARELGCTLSDIDDLGIVPVPLEPQDEVTERMAQTIRAVWLAEQTRYAL